VGVDMNRKRPSSESELKAIQKLAYGLACKSKYDEALEICNWLIEDKSTEVAGYRERAAVKEHMSDIEGAILDLQAVISRFNKEPADFHALGLLLLQSGATIDAIDAFNKAISLGEMTGNNYYTNSSLLFRADAHLKRADFAEALADAGRLPPGYQAYISGSGMRNKEQITAEASKRNVG
jgi:tetratricopeptide (TPR) repeat protein